MCECTSRQSLDEGKVQARRRTEVNGGEIGKHGCKHANMQVQPKFHLDVRRAASALSSPLILALQQASLLDIFNTRTNPVAIWVIVSSSSTNLLPSRCPEGPNTTKAHNVSRQPFPRLLASAKCIARTTRSHLNSSFKTTPLVIDTSPEAGFPFQRQSRWSFTTRKAPSTLIERV